MSYGSTGNTEFSGIVSFDEHKERDSLKLLFLSFEFNKSFHKNRNNGVLLSYSSCTSEFKREAKNCSMRQYGEIMT
jgi:hypothetical protein